MFYDDGERKDSMSVGLLTNKYVWIVIGFFSLFLILIGVIVAMYTYSVSTVDGQQMTVQAYVTDLDISEQGYAFPCPYTTSVTDVYGWRIHPITGKYAFHYGMDFAGGWTDTSGTYHSTSYGAPIVAAKSGTVICAKYRYSFGLCVEIQHDDGSITRYAHACYLCAKEGDTVVQGQVIALIGASGDADGAHLHFEVIIDGKRMNPADYLNIN